MASCSEHCASWWNRSFRIFTLSETPNVFRSRSLSLLALWCEREMRKRGYSRQPALPRPARSQENRRKQYVLCRDHLDWTKDQWIKVLLFDETWVIDGRHDRSWVTWSSISSSRSPEAEGLYLIIWLGSTKSRTVHMSWIKSENVKQDVLWLFFRYSNRFLLILGEGVKVYLGWRIQWEDSISYP